MYLIRHISLVQQFDQMTCVRRRSMSRGRALSAATGKGLKDALQQNKAIRLSDNATFKRGKMARKGEADRHIPTLRPKHLLSGKRGNGKTDRR